ncbi:Unknown protein sequence [Pseudomonas amygdali pv. lachrymans]|nr:Unknown protein sequence [Pseudomonas amygdali pv. lachrymans]
MFSVSLMALATKYLSAANIKAKKTTPSLLIADFIITK